MISRINHRASLLCQICWLLGGCSWIAYPVRHYEAVYTKVGLDTPAPEAARLSQLDATRVARGRYLVDIMGCAACHTDGALIGEPNAARMLAGSHLGIAYTDPFRDAYPGVVYPSNLTPDPKTGLGSWTDTQIAAAIRRGDRGSSAGPAGSAASGHLLVMSWPLYQHLTDQDASAIVAYLRSIPAIEHATPKRVEPGTRASTAYVYFGVFRSGPELRIP